jgi:glutamate N-acetyltransferase/amino-acid N-acetyltransferase
LKKVLSPSHPILVLLDPATAVAGVFTQSKCPSAPVEWCRAALRSRKARALVVNSGNANAFTGSAGVKTVTTVAKAVAAKAKCKPHEIFQASTGVIGEPLDPAPIVEALPQLFDALRKDAWADAARAIMTTDTFPKAASRQARLGGVTVTLNGIAKGSGMIAPDMATMLAFVATDAKLPAPVLRALLREASDRSFNCITVDGDTSTSDTLLLFATGAARARGAPRIDAATSPDAMRFTQALHDLMHELALLVVKDGEGLSKFVTIDVSGAESDMAARRIGFAIANSPLVKTAIAGEDPNWGRIVMAVGKSGEAADRDRLSITYGDVQVAKDGDRAATYDEKTIAKYMQGSEIRIGVDLGLGAGKATVWTCDLTHDYVSINADYRS